MVWQPIETAPRNQTFLAVISCAGEQTICTMRWSVAEAKNSRPEVWGRHVERVTHWMPLPDLPGAQPAPSVPEGVSFIAPSQLEGVVSTEIVHSYPPPSGWLRAIDEALIVAHLGVANVDDTYEQAKAKLDSLVGLHVDVATDPAVNGGWKLVPVEPTKKMVKACAYMLEYRGNSPQRIWAVMLAAAPEAKS